MQRAGLGSTYIPVGKTACACWPRGTVHNSGLCSANGAYRRTLLNDAPTEAQYLETRKVELPAGRFEANVRMTRAKFARRREDAEKTLGRQDW